MLTEQKYFDDEEWEQWWQNSLNLARLRLRLRNCLWQLLVIQNQQPRPRYRVSLRGTRHRREYSPHEENGIIGEYLAGQKISAICQKYRTSPGAIYRCLYQHGITLRASGRKLL